jgi:putative ABC transport system substrate-binding protein
LTARHPIKPTSRRCPSAWQPNPGRHSTYRRGKSVQTTGTTSIKAAGAVIGAQIVVLKAASESDIDATFATFVQRRPDAILVNHDALFSSRNDRFAALAARYAIPAIYPQRAFVAAGGEAGSYTGRILKGAKPAELPVLLPTKFELVINLKTAKVLGLKVPPQLLTLADEVIE